MKTNLGTGQNNKFYLGVTEINKLYLNGNIWTSSPAIPSYAVFDGSSYLDFGNPAELQITDNLIVEAGVRSHTILQGVAAFAIASYREGAGNDGWELSIRNNPGSVGGCQLTATILGSFAVGQWMNTFTDVPLGSDNTVRAEFISNSKALFEFGGSPVSTSLGSVAIASIWTGNANLRLGARYNGTSLDSFLVGDIDYIRIYDGATLVLDFNPSVYGDLLDHSVYNHPVTNTGVTLLPIPSAVPSYAVFDRSSFINFGNSAVFDGGTNSQRIVVDLETPASDGTYSILSKQASTALQNILNLRLFPPNNGVDFFGYQGGSAQGLFQANPELPATTRVTLDANFDGTSAWSILKDGLAHSSTTDACNISGTVNGLAVGTRLDGGGGQNYSYNGKIYSLKYYINNVLVLDFDPETHGDLLDHSVYNHPATNTGVTLLPI
jgi:hypothetical protein